MNHWHPWHQLQLLVDSGKRHDRLYQRVREKYFELEKRAWFPNFQRQGIDEQALGLDIAEISGVLSDVADDARNHRRLFGEASE